MIDARLYYPAPDAEPVLVEVFDGYVHFLDTYVSKPIGTLPGKFIKLVPEPQMPQPDWDNAPEWAQWWAVDPTGDTCWYQEEPILSITVSYCGWAPKTIHGVRQGNMLWMQELDLALGVDWRLTKHRRALNSADGAGSGADHA